MSAKGVKYPQSRMDAEDAFKALRDSSATVLGRFAFLNSSGKIELADPSDPNKSSQGFTIAQNSRGDSVVKRRGFVSTPNLNPAGEYFVSKKTNPGQTRISFKSYGSGISTRNGDFPFNIVQGASGFTYLIRGTHDNYYRGNNTADGWSSKIDTGIDAGGGDERVAFGLRLSSTHAVAPNRIIICSGFYHNVEWGGGVSSYYSDDEFSSWSARAVVCNNSYYPAAYTFSVPTAGPPDDWTMAQWDMNTMIEAGNGDIVCVVNTVAYNGPVLNRSNDACATWGAGLPSGKPIHLYDLTSGVWATRVRTGGSFPLAYKLLKCANDDILLFEFTASDGIWIYKSTDHGVTWTANASRMNNCPVTASSGTPSIDANGDIFVMFTDSADGKFYWQKSVDNGVSFTFPEEIVGLSFSNPVFENATLLDSGEMVVAVHDSIGGTLPVGIHRFLLKGDITEDPDLDYGDVRHKVGIALDFNILDMQLDPPEPLVSGWYGCTATEQVRDVVYLNSAGTVAQANATDGSKMDSVGFISEKIGDILCKVKFVEELSGFTGLTPLSKYYVDKTSGAISTSKPITAGNIVQMAGTAKNATTLVVNIGEGEVVP